MFTHTESETSLYFLMFIPGFYSCFSNYMQVFQPVSLLRLGSFLQVFSPGYLCIKLCKRFNPGMLSDYYIDSLCFLGVRVSRYAYLYLCTELLMAFIWVLVQFAYRALWS